MDLIENVLDWDDPFAELEAVETREKAIGHIRFFEAVRQFVTSPGARATYAEMQAAGLDQELIEFMQMLEDARCGIAVHPGQFLEPLLTLDVWLARMRGRWQVEDSEL